MTIREYVVHWGHCIKSGNGIEVWKEFCFLPKQCRTLNKRIWIKYGYRIEEIIELPPEEGYKVYKLDKYWLSEKAYTIKLLKQ